MKKSISSLYVLKAVAAFLIVVLHNSILFKNAWLPICMIAVPCFFMISGYFMPTVDTYGGLTISRPHCRKMLTKLGILIFEATLLYLAFELGCLCAGIRVGWGAEELDNIGTWGFWIRQLIFCNQLNPTLWFLMAEVYAIIIFGFLAHHGYWKCTYAIILVGGGISIHNIQTWSNRRFLIISRPVEHELLLIYTNDIRGNRFGNTAA